MESIEMAKMILDLRTRLQKMEFDYVSKVNEVAQLQYERDHDDLTGCLKRSAFHKKFSESKVNENSLVILDLDHFKSINDQYGHPMGDEVLKAVSSVLKDLLGSESVGRLGGEEFTFLVPTHSAGSILESVRTAISAIRINIPSINVGKGHLAEVKSISVTASFGFADIVGRKFEIVYKEADDALYFAKQNGRNRAVGFSFLKTA